MKITINPKKIVIIEMCDPSLFMKITFQTCCNFFLSLLL